MLSFGSQAIVGAEREDEAAGDGVAPKHRHGRLGEAQEGKNAVAESGERVDAGAVLRYLRMRGNEVLEVDAAAEVETGAEEGAGAGEDDRTDGVVLLSSVEGGGEVGEEVWRDGVRRRAVEREEADAIRPVIAADGGHGVES